MLNVRKYLSELMGVQKISDEDVRRELDELKLDNLVEELTRDGQLNADPQTQALARKAVAGGISQDDLITLLRAPKPLPASTQIVTPPSGPAPEDSTESAIQAEMAASGKPYHEAASAVAAGGSLMPPTGG